MQRTLGILAALMVVAVGSNARADANTLPHELFDDDLAHAPGSKEGRAGIEDIARLCNYSEFMRSGPRPQDIAACQKGVERAVAAGTAVSPDALRKLNDKKLGYGARLRVYDVLSRVADVRVLEPLVDALERTDRDPTDRDPIRLTLARISYASVGETSGVGSDRPDLATQVAAWRSWLATHRGMSRSELLADRIAEARARAVDADPEAAFVAARFLAQRKETQREGVDALQAILERPNLPSEVPPPVRRLLQRIAPAPAKKPSPSQKAPEEKQQNAAPDMKLRTFS